MYDPLIAMHLQLICQTIAPVSFGTSNTIESTPIVLDPKKLQDGYTPFPNASVAYKFFNDRVTWNSARKSCVDRGSNLAVVDSFDKYEFLMDMIHMRTNRPGPHVGIHRLFDDVEWVSATTGKPPASIPWAPLRWDKTPANKCLAMWNDDSGVGADVCTLLRPYIYEIPFYEESQEPSVEASENDEPLQLAELDTIIAN